MTIRSIAYAALALLLAAPAAAEDCSLKQAASLDMIGDPSRAIVVQVLVNGTQRKFMVDTGGVYTEISESVANELGLKKTEIAGQIFNVGGKQLKYGATVSSLTIGSQEAHNVHLLVTPDKGSGDDKIDGVLAPDFLQVFDVDLDFAKKKVNLFSQDHCAGKVVYWSPSYGDIPVKLDGFHIVGDFTLDGHDLVGIVDTGSTDTWLSEKQADQVYDFEETGPGVEKTDITIDGDTVYRKHFGNLGISSVSVLNPMIHIRPMAMERGFKFQNSGHITEDPIYGTVAMDSTQFILGLNVLTKLHVYIAYKEHKLYVTAADPH